MRVSSICFKDPELQSSVFSFDIVNASHCDATDTDDVATVDLEVYHSFISSVVGFYKQEPASHQTLCEAIAEHWDIFINNDVATRILQECASLGVIALSPSDTVLLNDDIEDYIAQWEQIKTEVKEVYRYTARIDALGSCLKDDRFEDTVTVGMDYYRARILPEGKTALDKTEMSCPDKQHASAGRANPAGIPYLYLSDQPATTFYEIRARYLDNVAVGTFRLKKNLKVLDLTSPLSLYLAFDESADMTLTAKHFLMIRKLSNDLSKPMRRYDSEVEYVPTQMLCEYCKALNFDGIVFRSSLYKQGINTVLFNPDNAECIDVENYEINTHILEGNIIA